MMVLMVRDAFSAHQPIITAVSDLFEANQIFHTFKQLPWSRLCDIIQDRVSGFHFVVMLLLIGSSATQIAWVYKRSA